MFKEVISLFVLFSISFYVSHSLSSAEESETFTEHEVLKASTNAETNLYQKQRIKTKTILVKSPKNEGSSYESSPSSVSRKIASIKYHSEVEHSVEDKNIEEMSLDVSVLSDDSVSLNEKIELLQDSKIKFKNREQARKILLEEIMDISFVNEGEKRVEIPEITDMNKYLESVSPADNEVYFFEVYDQLSKVFEGDEFREISLDLYERVPNKEVQGLIVLHLLDNDSERVNLNYLLDNISKNQVLSHIPDNYIIESIDNENYLTVKEGPQFEDELEAESNIVAGNDTDDVIEESL